MSHSVEGRPTQRDAFKGVPSRRVSMAGSGADSDEALTASDATTRRHGLPGNRRKPRSGPSPRPRVRASWPAVRRLRRGAEGQEARGPKRIAAGGQPQARVHAVELERQERSAHCAEHDASIKPGQPEAWLPGLGCAWTYTEAGRSVSCPSPIRSVTPSAGDLGAERGQPTVPTDSPSRRPCS